MGFHSSLLAVMSAHAASAATGSADSHGSSGAPGASGPMDMLKSQIQSQPTSLGSITLPDFHKAAFQNGAEFDIWRQNVSQWYVENSKLTMEDLKEIKPAKISQWRYEGNHNAVYIQWKHPDKAFPGGYDTIKYDWSNTRKPRITPLNVRLSHKDFDPATEIIKKGWKCLPDTYPWELVYEHEFSLGDDDDIEGHGSNMTKGPESNVTWADLHKKEGFLWNYAENCRYQLGCDCCEPKTPQFNAIRDRTKKHCIDFACDLFVELGSPEINTFEANCSYANPFWCWCKKCCLKKALGFK